MAEARAWVEKFKAVSTLRGVGGVEMMFSRSSGPGGQNVNKVNTKATLRCPTNAPWIPEWARKELVKSSHYVASTHSILLTSTVHRSQSQNVEDCFNKLHSLILDASSAPIKKETTPEQKKKVEALIKADAVRRRAEKTHRSDVKKGRRGGDWC
ncbi:uncharacterized protein LACBIDRAFT_330957 [Laccaria bicolor S238N-H82]|uniref:Predicted protein n=1 Tax=Laccaria bicolor (strain S238N-H82 / ATCC MYA-4686) TaxID=486041 RepID=B0DMT2_LACBS|nr:uncharacterized protein LACBIDRAFT_330957 [Laccaria bicolor S238N-H82]EDR04026.1 predicted protein [Laccaria bicolor S238N-H82]|eukprot:XP_001885281.1 predicted protein [Laccaria bicolor S238N-H82]